MMRGMILCLLITIALAGHAQARPQEASPRVVAVIGTGEVGGALARGWSEAGHTVILGSRAPESERVCALVDEIGHHVRAMAIDEAAAEADIVVLAVPFRVVDRVAAEMGDLRGKIVIDCTNPLSRDFKSLEVGHDTSAAEIIAGLLPGASIVKALNITGANNMADSTYPDGPLTIPVAGESTWAKRIVMGLVEDLGFEAVDAGPLSSARLLEPLALLWIRIAAEQDDGREMGFKIIRR